MRRRAHPTARDAGGRTLASRQLVALALGRHVDIVRRAVPPVACDVVTRVLLLDLDEAEALLTTGVTAST